MIKAIRIAALGMVFLSCTAAGLSASAKETARVRMLRLLSSLGRRFADEVRYRGDTVERIWNAAVSEECYRPLKLSPIAPSAGWRVQVSEQANTVKRACSEEELRLFGEWVDGLGKSDIEGQIRHSTEFANRMSAAADAAAGETLEKAKVCRTLGICGGIVLVLVLI